MNVKNRPYAYLHAACRAEAFIKLKMAIIVSSGVIAQRNIVGRPTCLGS